MSTPSISPVTISRIQNRRGTQDQFNELYPPGYDGVGGWNSIPGFTITNFPNVLMPGEFALCTDSRRIFMGNLNGEYIELAEGLNGNLFLNPITWVLPPSATFVPVTRTVFLPNPTIITLDYASTPFFSFLYGVTDSTSADWNSIPPTFSRNGKLEITAVENFPPTPTSSPVTLTDLGTEINTGTGDLIFKAQYNMTASRIEIWYKSSLAVNATLNTSTISWLPF